MAAFFSTVQLCTFACDRLSRGLLQHEAGHLTAHAFHSLPAITCHPCAVKFIVHNVKDLELLMMHNRRVPAVCCGSPGSRKERRRSAPPKCSP